VQRTPILYVHHRGQLGGAPRSLAELIVHLDDRYEPHVYLPDGPAATLLAATGARVHVGPVAMFNHSWDNRYAGARWLLLGREAERLGPHAMRLDALLRRYRFPIVHLNESQLLPAAAMAHRRGSRIVWHLRSSLAQEGRLRATFVRSAINRLATRAIAIDGDVARSFSLDVPVAVVHNSAAPPSTDLTQIEARRRIGIPEEGVTVGFVGPLRRVKGWPELVEAASLLRDAPVHFAVLGGGIRPPAFFRTPSGRGVAALGLVEDDESTMRDLVRADGLERSFTFLPFTEQTDDFYTAVDIVTFPNQGHGLGRPVLEAAAFGKPVIASGSRDGAGVLLPAETGLLLEPPTGEALATAIRLLATDAALRLQLGSRAAAHARVSFDPAQNAAAIMHVYREIVRMSPQDQLTRNSRLGR
jgi:glycosyltransferase involved in cell wall biosynthesis